jgi:FkbM family methyltransferase
VKSIRDVIRRATPRVVRNWLRQPKRTVRYLLDRAEYARKGSSEIQVRPDWQVRCHPASIDHFRVFEADPAQRAELDIFIEFCRPGMQFLDLGAHYGLLSLAALRYGGSEVRAVAVEASANAAGILRENLVANDAADRIKIINAAIGRQKGVLEMLSTGPAGSDYYVSPPPGRSDTTRVQQLSMSAILEQTGLVPTHIKMDIEGFEDEAIAGGLDCLRKYRPIIFLELHVRFLRARGRNPIMLLDSLAECGYSSFEENGVPISKSEIGRRETDCRLVCSPQHL